MHIFELGIKVEIMCTEVIAVNWLSAEFRLRLQCQKEERNETSV